MMEIFVVLAVIVLIIVLVVQSNKTSRLQKFIVSLYESGRLSKEEYISIFNHKPAYYSEKRRQENAARDENALPEPSAGSSQASVHEPTDPPDATSDPGADVKAPAKIATPAEPNDDEPQVKKDYTIPAILCVGVTLVCIAGAAFVTSSWNDLSNVAKLLSILPFSIVFYLAFGLAHYKLHIDNSARAFYIIASVTLATTVLAAEIFEFIPFFNTGPWIPLIPCTILALCAWIGCRVFKDTLFKVLAALLTYGLLISVSQLVFRPLSDHLFFVLPSLAVCVLCIGIVWNKWRLPEKFQHLDTALFITSMVLMICGSTMLESGGSAERWITTGVSVLMTIVCFVCHYKKPDRLAPAGCDILPAFTAILFYYSEAFSVNGLCLTCTVWMTAGFAANAYLQRSQKPSVRWISCILQMISYVIIWIMAAYDLNRLNWRSDEHFTCLYIGAIVLIPALYFLILGARRSDSVRALPMIAGSSLIVANAMYCMDELNPIIIAVLCAILYTAYALVPVSVFSERKSRVLNAVITPLVVSLFALIGFYENDNYEVFVLQCILMTYASCVIFASLHKLDYSKTNKICFGTVLYIIVTWMGLLLSDYYFSEADRSYMFLPGIYLLIATGALAYEHFRYRKSEIRPYQILNEAACSVFGVATAICSLYRIQDIFDQELWNLPKSYEISMVSAFLLLICGLVHTWIVEYVNQSKRDVAAAFGTAIAVIVICLVSLDGINTFFGIHIPLYFSQILVCVMMAALAYVMANKKKGYTHLRASWMLPCIALLCVQHDPYHIAHFAGVTGLSLNFLQYLKDKGKSRNDRIVLTISLGIITVASAIRLARISFETSWLDCIQPELIALILIAGSYLIARFVWKFNKVSHITAQAIAWMVLAGLYWIPNADGIIHAIVVSAVSVLSIMMAMHFKYFRYLVMGISLIAFIFLLETRQFWGSLQWWVYLLIVGIVLIVIAVANEMQRRKGSNIIKSAGTKLFKTWHW